MNELDSNLTNTQTEEPPKTNPTKDVNDYLCFNVRRVSRAITLICDESLRRAGLRSTQFTILLALSQSGSITIGKLAEKLLIDATALSRNLQPLIRSGYIELQPGSDRRTRFISLTDEGISKTSEALSYWNETHAKLQDLIQAGPLTEIQGSLNTLLHSLKEYK